MGDATTPGTDPAARLPAWLSGRFPPSLIDAAAFEVARRSESYPQAIYDRRISADDATADYCAWVALHDWLKRGRLPSWFDAGWPALDKAATKALAKVDAKLAAIAEADMTDAGQGELLRRRAGLFTIHDAVAKMRAWVEQTNAQLLDQSQQRAKVAA